MERKQVMLRGIPIDAVTAVEALTHIQHMLFGGHLKRFFHVGGQYHIATPNSEMLVEAGRNPAFKEVLRHTSLNIPDSAGLLWMARLTGQHLPERVTGVDTVTALCATLDARHPVFLLGAAPGVAQRAAETLRQKNPSLTIAGTYSGSPRNDDAPAILDRIRAAKPHLLLVAFGAPAQDLWIAKHLAELPSVRVAMGIGGTFDFLAGAQKRAPQWMQHTGFEWLYRLYKEPKRLKRIWNAVVVFPLSVILEKVQGEK
ncbi:MAG: WecB/TagA/CpsF family glycosyltransferase [Candidatus Peribacteraceae bacterium]|jgi:N-acetylglucosaminyldiphosphoundecaprenol N-acetyl-beta-D-mannosaminyltransferase